MNDDKVRFIMVTTGRSGSSLLAAIIADAGGKFGFPSKDEWDPESGAMEHPLAQQASLLFRRAYYLRRVKRLFFFYKYLIDIRRSLGKKKLRKVLKDAHFIKSNNMDLWVWHLTKMGCRPRIIATYRRFSGNARGLFIMMGMGFDDIVEYYCRINQNALLMLDTYGGCAVSYEEVVDPDDTAWADALALTTGLSRNALLAARGKRIKDKILKYPEVVGLSDPTADRIYENLRKLKGVAVEPSPQFRRKLGS